MKKRFLLLYAVTAMLLLSACNAYKNVPYFQDLDKSKQTTEDIKNFSALTIQNSDILGITVSSLNPKAYSDSSARLSGYLVDQNGEIKLPLIGKISAAGLTTGVLADQIQSKLTTYLREPAVTVRMLNFKVSVMGDVLKPDVYKIQSERVTVTEALTMAGDLNITAKRKNILLIREVDGKREFIPIDITSAKLFTSPYYYLKNNDVLYVQPDKTKYASVDGGYRTVSLVLSALSIVAIVLSNSLR